MSEKTNGNFVKFGANKGVVGEIKFFCLKFVISHTQYKTRSP